MTIFGDSFNIHMGSHGRFGDSRGMTSRPKNLATFFRQRAESTPDAPAVLFRSRGERDWREMTYGEWAMRAEALAAGLQALGVEPGTNVVVSGRTTREWLIVSWAVAFAGGALVPVHAGTPPADFAAIVKAVDPRFVFLENPALLELFKPGLQELSGRIAVFETQCVLTDPPPGRRSLLRLDDVVSDRDEAVSLEQVESLGKSSRDAGNGGEESSLDSPAMIIYTPGTQGEHRGVVLSNANLLFQGRTLAFLLPVTADDTQLLFLPLSHILGVIAYLSAIASGTPLALGGGLRTLLEDLQAVRPTYMVGVPRVYEKVIEKIHSLANDFSVIWRQVFRQGIEAATRAEERKAAGQDVDLASRVFLDVARRTVFPRCREMFGGRMRFLVSGGAPLSTRVAYAIAAFGIPVLEGFGLTETSGATHMNRLESARIGTVGLPLPMVETKTAADGEILIRGPGLMGGYLEECGSVRCALDEDGWFHTGDLGVIDDCGRLTITGRKKNLIVTATGKNVVPSRIETVLQSSVPLISHCVVVGDERSFLVALVTLNQAQVEAWASEEGISAEDPEKLRTDIRLYREIEARVEQLNQRFSPHERVRKFAILEGDFSAESGELTHDLKVKRSVVLERHGDVAELLYEERY